MKDKRYIILGIDNKGQYWGYTEHSFSMGFSENEVKVFALELKGKWSEKATNQNEWNWCKGQVEKLNKKKANGCKWKAFRVGSKHCPVEVDFSEVMLMQSKKIKYDKYKYRNQPFKLKENYRQIW